MAETDQRQPASVEQIRLGTGFNEDEHGRVVEQFRKLDKRLQRWSAEAVDMELSIKERDTSSQAVTFECWIHTDGNTHFVASSKEALLQDALMDCREDMWRQIDEFVSRKTDGRKR
jgi:hypothetical protein